MDSGEPISMQFVKRDSHYVEYSSRRGRRVRAPARHQAARSFSCARRPLPLPPPSALLPPPATKLSTNQARPTRNPSRVIPAQERARCVRYRRRESPSPGRPTRSPPRPLAVPCPLDACNTPVGPQEAPPGLQEAFHELLARSRRVSSLLGCQRTPASRRPPYNANA